MQVEEAWHDRGPGGPEFHWSAVIRADDGTDYTTNRAAQAVARTEWLRLERLSEEP